MPRQTPLGPLALVAAAAALSACGGGGGSSGPAPGSNCPPDRTMFYCSGQGSGCLSDQDCCSALSCDPATRSCTDGGMTGLPSGFRCSPNSPCLSDVDPSARQRLPSGQSVPVYCDQRAQICEWIEPQGSLAYCSDLGQACNRASDCCGTSWCDQAAGTCTDGRTAVPSGSRCSDQTLCLASEVVAGQERPLYCDSDNVCKFTPYCADP